MASPTFEEVLDNLVAYSVALLLSLITLILLPLYVPLNRKRTVIYRITLAMIACTAFYFALFTFIFAAHMVGFAANNSLLYVAVIGVAASTVGVTLAETVLLLRVKAVYPEVRWIFRAGVVLVAIRTVVGFVGRVLYYMHGLQDFYLAIPGLVLECVNNLLFTGLFLLKIRRLSNSEMFKSRAGMLTWISVETALFPTIGSVINVVLGLVQHGVRGSQVLTPIAYVLGIPAACIWAWRTTSEYRSSSEEQGMFVGSADSIRDNTAVVWGAKQSNECQDTESSSVNALEMNHLV